MQWTINYGIANVSLAMYGLRHCHTVYHINKFDKVTFFDQLVKFRVSKFVILFNI